MILGGMLALVFVTGSGENLMLQQPQKFQGDGEGTCQNGRPSLALSGDGDGHGNDGN